MYVEIPAWDRKVVYVELTENNRMSRDGTVLCTYASVLFRSQPKTYMYVNISIFNVTNKFLYIHVLKDQTKASM